MSSLKKGWCPTLERPMETGDGLLVRLHIRYGIVTADIARAIAACALRYGNGHIDLTSRGNLQIRGVTPERYDALYQEIIALGLSELPRPPRTDYPDYAPSLGFLATQAGTGTLGFGLAFGRLEAAGLGWLADTAQHYGNGMICLSPWRTIFIPGVAIGKAEALVNGAANAGFITAAHDARRTIHTCPGAPACSSAQGETRELALTLAKAFPDLVAQGKTLHVSGCAKGCACSASTSAVITARANGYDVAFDTTIATQPAYRGLDVKALMQTLGETL